MAITSNIAATPWSGLSGRTRKPIQLRMPTRASTRTTSSAGSNAMKREIPVSSCEFRVRDAAVPAVAPRPSTLDPLRRAFTLIELLTVLAIIGIIAAIFAPSVSHLLKGDNTLAATRQMLDDCARARQLAIGQRTTVYMVFIPTNFWANANASPWGALPTSAKTNTLVAQLYSSQLNAYIMVSLLPL